MSNFAEDIEAAAGGESIEAIVIGDMGWAGFGDDGRHRPGLDRKGEVLTWDEARPLLDYAYDCGYGAPDCQAIAAYTANKVIYVSQYDGATAVCFLPRHPTAGDEPDMPGG